jgi:hypothetical protein
MLLRIKQLHEELASKATRRKEMRYPPAAGLPARQAMMCVPLTGGVVTWRIKIVRLAYAITIGVCSPDPLQQWLGVGVEQYTVSLNHITLNPKIWHVMGVERYTVSDCALVRVCVCVCENESERARERERDRQTDRERRGEGG